MVMVVTVMVVVGVHISSKRTWVRLPCCDFKLWASSFSCMNEYLAIDSSGHLCTNILHALIAAWLGTSQRSRDGVHDLTGLKTGYCYI